MNLSARIEDDSFSLCTVCGGDRWSFVREGCDLYQPNDDASFKLYRCLSCGQVMQNPLPTPRSSAKLTLPNMPLIGPRGRSPGGLCGRFFVTLRPGAACGGCDVMARAGSFWKSDAALEIFFTLRNAQAGR